MTAEIKANSAGKTETGVGGGAGRPMRTSLY